MDIPIGIALGFVTSFGVILYCISFAVSVGLFRQLFEEEGLERWMQFPVFVIFRLAKVVPCMAIVCAGFMPFWELFVANGSWILFGSYAAPIAFYSGFGVLQVVRYVWRSQRGSRFSDGLSH